MASPSDSRVESMTGGFFPFEYLMRYVDDEPNIHDHRFIMEVVDSVAFTALRFAVVGEVDGATKLLTLLHNHGLDPFQADEGNYVFLKPCMYFAWAATSSWPSWIAQEERTEEKLQELEVEGRDPWLERFNGEWSVDNKTAEKAEALAEHSIPLFLPDRNGTLAGQVIQAEQSVAENCKYAKSPNGPLHVRYVTKSMWWRQGRYAYPFVQVYRSAGLTLAFDIYLRLGNEKKVEEILPQMCKRFDCEEQLEMMACSRLAWQKLWLQPENPVLKFANIHPAKIRPGISRAISMLETRLRSGPRRRYMNKSMAQLVSIISENTYLNCPYKAFRALEPPYRPDNKNGLRHRSCSLREMVTLEKRLGVTLPADYKELLSISNGMEDIWNGRHALNFFCPVDKVKWEKVDHIEGCEFSLLRDGDPVPRGGNRLDWPSLTESRLIRISGGVCGPDLWLVPRSVIEPSKEYFFNEYNKRMPEQQRELDRVINETYGSKERFKGLDWALVAWSAWGIVFVPYNGIRDMLERLAEESLTKYRPWLYVFDPDFRLLFTPPVGKSE